MFTGDGCCPPFVPLAGAYCFHREAFNKLDIRDTVATLVSAYGGNERMLQRTAFAARPEIRVIDPVSINNY